MTIAQTIGRVNTKIETTNRSREFAEYAIALMRSKGNREMALHHADASGLSQRVRTAIKPTLPATPQAAQMRWRRIEI